MSYAENSNPVKPWHKEYYVWFIIFFPMLAVVAGIYTIYLAVSTDDGLVVDDYYKKGLEINRTLERDQAATDYGLEADIMLNPQLKEVVVTLSANDTFSYPQKLSVGFLNATRAGEDQQVNLIFTGNQTYRGNLEPLRVGKWYVQIEQDEWRLTQLLQID